MLAMEERTATNYATQVVEERLHPLAACHKTWSLITRQRFVLIPLMLHARVHFAYHGGPFSEWRPRVIF